MSTITFQPPERTVQQRRQALDRANEIRALRAQLKTDLKARGTSPLAVIAEPPEWALTMPVLKVMLATRGVGPVKATKVLNRTRCSASKTLGGLSDRQRAELLYVMSRSPGFTA